MPRPEVFSPHCLKLAAWPALHQAAWHLAFAEAGLFEQPKPAARWRPASIHKTRAGYGVYLSWLDYRGYLVAAAPGTLVTRELVRAYIDELEGKMRAAAADLEFEEAGRLRDEIRRLEQEELGLPVEQHRAAVKGHASGGKPGTRTSKYSKMRAKGRGH